MRIQNSPSGFRSAIGAISVSDTIDATDAIERKRCRTWDPGLRTHNSGPWTHEARWLVVQTKPRVEDKVVACLGYRGVSAFLPRLLVRHRHGSRRWEVLEPLFPGYLFTRFCPEPALIDCVRWTPGVRRILGDGEQPVLRPTRLWLISRRGQGTGGYIVPGPPLAPGARVRFRTGPFAHLEGIVQRPPSQAERARVLLEMLNRNAAVEVDLAELELV